MSQFARSSGITEHGTMGAYLWFQVSPEAVDQNRDWSEPVRFRFEENDDGTVTMWLQTVEAN